MSELPQGNPTLSMPALNFLRATKAILDDRTLGAEEQQLLREKWPEVLPDCPEDRHVKLKSTRGAAGSPAEKSWKDGLFEGLAEDGGLFMPDRLPQLPPEAIEMMRELSYREIAYLLYRSFIPAGDIDSRTLRNMVDRAYDFAPRLEHLKEHIYIGRLDEGPTASFKDFAGQFLGELLNHACEEEGRTADIVVATSGDTGVAIAAAFKDQPNVNVTILYPTDGVSPIQEKQMLSFHGSNVQVIPVRGNFDDCQRLAKAVQRQRSTNDERLKNITSANSINIWRLIPQMAHFFYLSSRLPKPSENEQGQHFAVPSGNAGHVLAGIMAKRMGLPVDQFIVGTNANNILSNVIETAELSPHVEFTRTSSNSMDIQVPSNLARILTFYEEHHGDGHFDLEGALKYLKQRNFIVWMKSRFEQWLSEDERRRKRSSDLNDFLIEPEVTAKIEEVLGAQPELVPDLDIRKELLRDVPVKTLLDFGYSPSAHQAMQAELKGYSFPDDRSNHAKIAVIYDRNGVLLEPHGVIGVAAAAQFREEQQRPHDRIVCLETMHPGKANIWRDMNLEVGEGVRMRITFDQHPQLAKLEGKTFEKPEAMEADPETIINRIHTHATTRARIKGAVGDSRTTLGDALQE